MIEVNMQADVLGVVLESMLCVADDGAVLIRDGGVVEFRAIDPRSVLFGSARVRCCEVRMSDGADMVSIDLTAIGDMMKFVDRRSQVTLRADEDTTEMYFDKVHAYIDAPKDSLIQMVPVDFRLNMGNAVHVYPLQGDVLVSRLKSISMISDVVVFDAHDGGFHIGYVDADGITGIEQISTVLSGNRAVAMYSLDYMADLYGILDHDVPVDIEFGNNAPVKITMQWDDVDVMYYMAPRVARQEKSL